MEKKKKKNIVAVPSDRRAPWLRWEGQPGVSMMERMVHHTRQRWKLCHRLVVFFLVSKVVLCASKHFVIPDGNPVADPKAVVQVSDHVRFTVLTSSLIRIERAIGSDGFQDEQTMVVFNRRLPVPKFSVSKVGSNGIQIETSSLILTFFGDGSHDEFSAKNLQVEMKNHNIHNISTWKYGDSTAGNLFGTFRTYDTLKGFQDLNCTRHKPWVVTSEPEHCAFGLISRSGWALFDDSRSPVLRNDWVYANTNGKCRVDNKASTPCFGANVNPGGLRYANETACRLAGCCWQGHKNGSTQFVDLVWYTNSVENVLSTTAFPCHPRTKKRKPHSMARQSASCCKIRNGRSNLYPMKLWRKH